MSFTVELSGSDLNLLICALDKEISSREGGIYAGPGWKKEHARARWAQARRLAHQLALIAAEDADAERMARMEGRALQLLEDSRERRERTQRMTERELRKILTPPAEEVV